MSFGDKRLDAALDRYITGNYGEDQFAGYFDCPMCENDDLTYDEQLAVEEDMEYDHKSCLKCGLTFGEMREEMFDEEEEP